MTEVCKLSLTLVALCHLFEIDINFDTTTRGHTEKLVVIRCRYDVRKYSFCISASEVTTIWRYTNVYIIIIIIIINVWNSLRDEIISAPSVNTFKNRLDKFWAEQEVFYNNNNNNNTKKL